MRQADEAATSGETVEGILKRSKRPFVPIRKNLAQSGKSKKRVLGPLHSFVRRKDPRGLDLYLLIHAIVSKEPYDVALPAATWARALGLPPNNSSTNAVSKTLRRLDEQYRLIDRKRDGRWTRITLLDEGGQGEPYVHPGTKGAPDGTYLKLPHSYWTNHWHSKLTLPAKAVLLIALTLTDKFLLPIEKGPEWYGISADTIQKGLAELGKHMLIVHEEKRKKAPLAPLGFTQDRRFTLQPPFGPLGKTQSGAT